MTCYMLKHWKREQFCTKGEATVLDLKLAIQARIAVPRKEQRLAAPCHCQIV